MIQEVLATVGLGYYGLRIGFWALAWFLAARRESKKGARA